MPTKRDLTRVPIDVDEMLGNLQPHLWAIGANATAGKFRDASHSATQAIHRLLDVIEHLQNLTDEEPKA